MSPSAQPFVGRQAELAALERLLQPDGPRVAYVHGVGGIGKTSLVRAFLRAHPEVAADELDSTALPQDLGTLVERARVRQLLVVDGLEQRTGLAELLRRQLLGQLAPESRLIVASREPPAPRWTAELAPGAFLPLALEGLADRDAASLLGRWGVTSRVHAELVALSHGHPLTLALAAGLPDPEGFVRDGLEAAPELIEALLRALGAARTDPRIRDAVTVCAIARRTTEPLLRDVLGDVDVPAVFDALRRESWSLVDRDGLYPHDIVRDVLRAEAKWRDRAAYDRVFAGVAAHAAAQIRRHGVTAMPDTVFLLADHPVYGRIAAHRGAALPGPMEPTGDLAHVRRMLAPLAGEATLDQVAGWVARGRMTTYVIHGEPDAPSEVVCLLDGAVLFEDGPRDDPAVEAGRRLVVRMGLRPESRVLFSRVAMSVGHGVTSPLGNARILLAGLGWALATGPYAALATVVGPADFWRPMLEHTRALGVFEEVRVGDMGFFVVIQDLRILDVAGWLHAQLFPPPRDALPEVETLDRDEHGCAVREALKVLCDDEALTATRLARTPLVYRAAAPGEARGSALARLLREAVAAVAERDPRAGAALDRTYVNPAPKQLAAASELGLSFATYRRALGAGVAAMIEQLWARELAASARGDAAGA